ncbi:hypothetical protein ADUPG1_011062 [Aduncisulcus paluster]|uniref:Uncharacterized protein n=1 Tax=Aduncisulcus paluster TaxID=2918883 RepID=A0ABQ5JU22_9EUKA|nr:hypothetical protein ADUPG1_011062 [Aduncisulcus paluster]
MGADEEMKKIGRECELIIKEVGKEVEREGKEKKSDNEWVKNKLWRKEWRFVLVMYYADGVSVSGKVRHLALKATFGNLPLKKRVLNENLLEIGMIDEVRVLDPHGTAAMIIEEDIQELERG